MAEIPNVQLTPEEQTLYDSARVLWEDYATFDRWDHKERIAILEKMGQLSGSLIKRKAIPQIRRDYFTEPELNIGTSRSRMEVCEGNGTKGTAIFRHGHFAKYLQYFIHGPRLPHATIQGFCQIIEDDRVTSGMVLDQIEKFVRSEIRTKRLDKHDAAEEFYKLALEIDRPDIARNVRSAAMRVRA